MSKDKKEVISKPVMKKEEEDKTYSSDSKSEASASDSPRGISSSCLALREHLEKEILSFLSPTQISLS